jgi:hypothetical protein
VIIGSPAISSLCDPTPPVYMRLGCLANNCEPSRNNSQPLSANGEQHSVELLADSL